MAVCGVCGKRIAVTWPEFWVYKHGKGGDVTYYCSENCMIVADTREMKDRIGWVDPHAEMTEEEIEAVTHGRPVGFRRLRRTAKREDRPPPAVAKKEEQPVKPAGQESEDRTMGNGMNCNKLTRAQKAKAVEIAVSGGDPQEYLRTCGSKNPSAAWFYIKKTVAKADPKLYEKIPEKPGTVINENGQAVPVGAENAETEKDPLEGFEAVDVKPQKEQEADLTIKAEDLQADVDPAVEKMEAMAAEEAKPENNRENVRQIVDAVFGLPENLEKREEPERSKHTAGALLNGGKLKTEVMTMFGIHCEVTGLKVEEFEFRRTGDDLMMDYPGPGLLWMDKSLATVKLTVEQWKMVVDLVPKVLKIFGMD